MNRPRGYDGDFTFTLFIVLPSDEVCSLRQLPSGVTVHEIKGRLELSAGLPAHVYYLVYPDGDRLEDYQRLMVQDNVKDGYILRVKVLENWEVLLNAVSRNNIQNVLMNGGVQIKGSGVVSSAEEQLEDRGETALYIASYNGFHAMCSKILSIGKCDQYIPYPAQLCAIYIWMCQHLSFRLRSLHRAPKAVSELCVSGFSPENTRENYIRTS